MFFFHYWRRREPPVSLRIADFRSAFIVYGHFLFFILVFEKFFSGKTNGFFTFLLFVLHFPFGALKVKVFQQKMILSHVL